MGYGLMGLMALATGQLLLLWFFLILVVFLVGVFLFYKVLRGEEDDVFVLRLLE